MHHILVYCLVFTFTWALDPVGIINGSDARDQLVQKNNNSGCHTGTLVILPTAIILSRRCEKEGKSWILRFLSISQTI